MPRSKTEHWMSVDSAKFILRKLDKKYGSLRKVSLKLGISTGHIYRWRDGSCLMRKTTYLKLKSY